MAGGPAGRDAAAPDAGSLRYVRPGALEPREYQAALAAQAARENCLVVLPTGLGKTAVALRLVSRFLEGGRGGALFLAPTRVLAGQHRDYLAERMTISDISLVTGGDPPAKRRRLWASSVACATPEVARNDLASGLVDAAQFSLAVFDEAHRAVGDYAYAPIAERMAAAGARIVGMTATLPSERDKAEEVAATLRARSIAQRTEDDPDVRPYVQRTDVEMVRVELPREHLQVRALLARVLDGRYAQLGRLGLRPEGRSLSALLRLRPRAAADRRAARPLYAAIRLTYAINMLEVHGMTPFIRFCERAREKGGAGARDFDDDPDLAAAVRHARDARARGMEHPKLARLAEVLRGHRGRALVFSSYRDSVELIRSSLEAGGLRAASLIGKAGEGGLRQAGQVEAVRRFRDGELDVLVATRVGEEGLDISDVGLVVFYDSVPSSIRYVQRRGRTGRRAAGRMVALIAGGTVDEAYHWIGRRKISAARGMGEKVGGSLREAGQAGLDGYMG